MSAAPETSLETAPTVRPPTEARRRADRLLERRAERLKRQQQMALEFQRLNRFLELAPEISTTLEALGQQLFAQVLAVVKEKLTIALREILDQPLELLAEAQHLRNSAAVTFSIRRNGNDEDLLRGQGGSVANVLSVGLRMFALATLDEGKHRRFLVLDEQDCWLRPDLVPRLVKIVRDAGKALGYQTLMISHHDSSAFEQYADKIVRFEPDSAGCVRATEVRPRPEAPEDD